MTEAAAALSPEEQEYAAASKDAMADRQPGPAVDGIGHILMAEFANAKLERLPTEERWMKDLRQYRGKYETGTLSAIGNRSQAFIKKTRVKVKTIDSRVADLLFPAGSEKNWSVDPTPKPELPKDMVDKIKAGLEQQLQVLQREAAGQPPQDPSALTQAMAAPPAPAQLPPDALDNAIMAVAKAAAMEMSKTIDDQLTEARYKDMCLKAVHSGNLFGTGVLKGPLVDKRVRSRFKGTDDGQWAQTSEEYVLPFVDFVPLWRWYPDMASSELEGCRYAWEWRRLTKNQMVELSRRPSFSKAKLVEYLLSHPRGMIELQTFDQELRDIGDRLNTPQDSKGLYDILERWGWLDGETLRNAGVEIPDGRMHETFFSNVWMLPNGCVVKAVLQPINGITWPYHLYYFDKDETSIFGEGLAAIMRDDQEMMNAAVRMLLDNAAISAGPQLEIFTDLVSPHEKTDEIHPWKIWKRTQAGQAQFAHIPAVRAIDLPSHMAELLKIIDLFETNSDEVTAIPRYMSGDNATSGAAGTSSGLSMLMGAANIVIKDLINAWDEGITRPFLTALYIWNMVFNPDPKIKGDFSVKARGTASLVAKETRARMLNEFAALVADPQDAPFVKRRELLQKRAEANELGDVVKTQQEVEAEQQSPQAQKIQQLQEQLAAAQLAEAQGKAAKLMAEVEVAKTKVTEMLANVELTIARAVETRVTAVFEALQAGGVATNSPFIAPAGDEILRSSGFVDKTPNPSIAQLNGPPVQDQAGSMQLLNKGQHFEEQPRGDAIHSGDEEPVAPTSPNTGLADASSLIVHPPNGGVGKGRGIETPEIES